jgi:hypothetical protein
MNISYKAEEDLTLTVYNNGVEIGNIFSTSYGFTFEFKEASISDKYWLYGDTTDKIKRDLEEKLRKAMKIGKILLETEGGKQ